MLFVPGLVLGVTYEATDNLVVPSLIHGAYNATLFTLAYLSVTFG
jgi:membrane protease YdiL (CAAX protease family)